MVKILEQYFVQNKELVLTNIGSLQLFNKPAQWVGATLHAPVTEIIFVEEKKKPTANFYHFLAEALSVHNDKAAIEYEEFLVNALALQGSKLSIGNLGHLKKLDASYIWVSHFNTANYYKDITISPIEANEQANNSLSIQWYWMALILTLIAAAAILFKSL